MHHFIHLMETNEGNLHITLKTFLTFTYFKINVFRSIVIFKNLSETDIGWIDFS